MDDLRTALKAALPDVRVLAVGKRVEGYANDRWTVESDAGPLLVKVRRIPEEDPRQIEGQVRAQRWLTEIGFPTPELLSVVWRCPQLGGRQLSVQRYVDAVEETGEVLEATPIDRRAAYFEGFGRAVGMLHSFDLPDFGGWLDDSGVRHDSWAEAIHPASALRCVRDHPSVVPAEALAEAERRIERGLAVLPDVTPRLVHRDLHADNTLLGPDGGFGAVIDFEMVREWDFPYDFSCRLDGLFDFFAGSREPFMAGYLDVAGELPDSFGLRDRLYSGIYLVEATAGFIEGNEGYAGAPRGLRSWLEGSAPG